MKESIGTAVLDEPVREALGAPPSTPALSSHGPFWARHATVARRHADGRWHSSLCASDLQCLLGVIESELIPRLLNGYSPARGLPRGLGESPS